MAAVHGFSFEAFKMAERCAVFRIEHRDGRHANNRTTVYRRPRAP
jgi:hypothetical protein